MEMTSLQSRLFYWMLRLTKNHSPLKIGLPLEGQRLKWRELSQRYVKYFPANVDDVIRFAEKAKRAGVEVRLEVEKGMWHVYQKFGLLPESKRAIASIGEFIRQKFDQNGRPA